MADTILKVEGMMCEVCTSKVESALMGVPGVISAKADAKKGTATVITDGVVDDEELVMAVLNAGFKAKIKHGLFR